MASKEIYNVYGFTLTTPPQAHFAFNPWYYSFTPRTETAYNVARITFNVAGETREPYNGGARFDLRRWVQSQFDGVVEGRMRAMDYGSADAGAHPCVMNVNPGNMDEWDSSGDLLGEILSIDWFPNEAGWWAIWGVAARGEEYGGDETLRWWYNYPFTIDVLTPGGAGTAVMDIPLTDGTTRMLIETVLSSEGALFCPLRAEEKYTPGRGDPQTDWTAPFVITVGGQAHLLNQELTVVSRTVTLLPDCAPVGQRGKVYLRWIDSMGRIRYWLFTQTDSTEAVSATAWNRAEQPEPELYEDGVNDAQTQRQELTAVRTRTLAAPLLSEDDWAVAGSVVRSPLIDEFDGYDSDGSPMWHRVNVVAGSYTRDRSHLQDLTFQITDRTQTTQSF